MAFPVVPRTWIGDSGEEPVDVSKPKSPSPGFGGNGKEQWRSNHEQTQEKGRHRGQIN